MSASADKTTDKKQVEEENGDDSEGRKEMSNVIHVSMLLTNQKENLMVKLGGLRSSTQQFNTENKFLYRQ